MEEHGECEGVSTLEREREINEVNVLPRCSNLLISRSIFCKPYSMDFFLFSFCF